MKGYTIQNSINLLEKNGTGGGGGSTTAAKVSYDNTASGLSGATVQAAIDELAEEVPVLYASTEKQIGKLSDNTPVYEKSIYLTGADLPSSGVGKVIPVDNGASVLNIGGTVSFSDEIIDINSYVTNSFFSSCRHIISENNLALLVTFTGKTCTGVRVTYQYTKPATTNTRKKK